MNTEELIIKLECNDVMVLLDALGKAQGQPGLMMPINRDYVDSCSRIIDKITDAISNEILIQG